MWAQICDKMLVGGMVLFMGVLLIYGMSVIWEDMAGRSEKSKRSRGDGIGDTDADDDEKDDSFCGVWK